MGFAVLLSELKLCHDFILMSFFNSAILPGLNHLVGFITVLLVFTLSVLFVLFRFWGDTPCGALWATPFAVCVCVCLQLCWGCGLLLVVMGRGGT